MANMQWASGASGSNGSLGIYDWNTPLEQKTLFPYGLGTIPSGVPVPSGCFNMQEDQTNQTIDNVSNFVGASSMIDPPAYGYRPDLNWYTCQPFQSQMIVPSVQLPSPSTLTHENAESSFHALESQIVNGGVTKDEILPDFENNNRCIF